MKLIPLTHGKHALVSDRDYARVKKLSWRYVKGYAVRTHRRNGVKTTIHMHRFILGVTSKSKLLDHRDGNGINNQRRNLRRCTKFQNAHNRKLQTHSSSFKGVSWWSRQQKWAAEIKVKRNRIFLGYFDEESEAAKVYDAAAIKFHGSFARTNKEMRGQLGL